MLDSMSKSRARKRINPEHAQIILDNYLKDLVPRLSIRQYVEKNFTQMMDILDLGVTLKEIREFLASHGIDVGHYVYFCSVFRAIKAEQEIKRRYGIT